MTRAVAAVAVLAAACFNPSFDQPACSLGECPTGFTCDPVDSICRPAPPAVDARTDGTPDDDAPDPDALEAIDAPVDAPGCVPTTESCNGADDDCDLAIDETFPTLGQPCDGPDGDQCNEGTVRCQSSGAAVVCSDETGANGELCNELDDDCDLSVDEDFFVGTPCDGPDSDACQEGFSYCEPSTGTLECSDQTGPSPGQCPIKA